MKRLFILLALFLFAAPFIAAQECGTLSGLAEDNLAARYKYYYYRAEIRAISMDAVIGLYKENGIDTSGLESIKSDFTALYDAAEEAADDGDAMAFSDAVQDGIDLISDFRSAAREQSVEGVLGAIAAALERQENYLKDLREDAVDAKKDVYVKVFDARACHHQAIIDRWEERGVDVDELQSDLDAILAKKDLLLTMIDEADESCDAPFVACTTPEADDLRKLHREINDDFRELNEKFRDFFVKGVIQAAIDLQQKNLDWLRLRLNALEIRGVEIIKLDEIYNDAKLINKEAQAALNKGDLDEAKDKFNGAKREIARLREGIQEAAK